MPEHSLISAQSAQRITLVSVNGLADAQAAGWALALSQSQMPGCRALLCSPVRPADLPESVEHLEIAPLDYQGYSWFVLFMLWRVIHTEFALIVQDDGWVLDGSLWSDEYLHYDYVGAPVHLAKVSSPEGDYWSRGFVWANGLPDGHSAVPVLNGGFSLRSQKIMRAFADHPQLQVTVPAPDQVFENPLKLGWSGDVLNEDVQLTGILRPQLEALGFRFAPLELATRFAIEYAGPQHLGMDAMGLFGHHARTRKLAGLNPLTVRCPISRAEVGSIFGEAQLMEMLERRGYQIEYANEPARRRVYDCFTYNGEFEVLQIRLHELSDVVDCFVIVEATRTFAGDAKLLTLDLSAPELAQFKDRIRYVVVDDMPDDPPGVKPEDVERDWLNDPPKTGFWRREMFQRNQVFRGVADAADDDLLLLSDVDEIPRAQIIQWMLTQSVDQVFGLELDFYYFYANYQNTSGPEASVVWSMAMPKKYMNAENSNRLRMGARFGGIEGLVVIEDAGWHFSYFGMNEEQVKNKIKSFSHQEYNRPDFIDGIDLKSMVRSGKDLYGRLDFLWSITSKNKAPKWMCTQEEMDHFFLEK